MRERLEELGEPSFWPPPEDATPEQIAEFEAFVAKMLVPDESITTWVDISGDAARAQVGRDPRARDPDQRRQPVHARFGLDGWREFWASEAYILRESRVDRPRDLADRTRPRSPAIVEGASASGRAPAVGAPCRPRRAHQGRSPFDASNTWPMTTLPSPAGSRKFGWALSRMMCGRIRAWTRSCRGTSARA